MNLLTPSEVIAHDKIHDCFFVEAENKLIEMMNDPTFMRRHSSERSLSANTYSKEYLLPFESTIHHGVLQPSKEIMDQLCQKLTNLGWTCELVLGVGVNNLNAYGLRISTQPIKRTLAEALE